MASSSSSDLARPANLNAAEVLEKIIVRGDLSQLTPEERILHYKAVCDSVGLNPLTKPFEYLMLGDGQGRKLVLYATRSCTDQLRKLHGVSVTITDRRPGHGVYVVTAQARTPDDRTDESTGAVPLEREIGEWRTNSNGKRYFAGTGKFEPLKGEALANALMKAETKAKRRVTLSICGLGVLDETEVETVPTARQRLGPSAAAPKSIAAPPEPPLGPKPGPKPPPDVLPGPDVAAKCEGALRKLLTDLARLSGSEPAAVRAFAFRAAGLEADTPAGRITYGQWHALGQWAKHEIAKWQAATAEAPADGDAKED